MERYHSVAIQDMASEQIILVNLARYYVILVIEVFKVNFDKAISFFSK